MICLHGSIVVSRFSIILKAKKLKYFLKSKILIYYQLNLPASTHFFEIQSLSLFLSLFDCFICFCKFETLKNVIKTTTLVKIQHIMIIRVKNIKSFVCL